MIIPCLLGETRIGNMHHAMGYLLAALLNFPRLITLRSSTIQRTASPFPLRIKGFRQHCPDAVPGKPGLYIGLLNCRDPGPSGEHLGIYLVRRSKDQFARVDADEIWIVGGGPNLLDPASGPMDPTTPVRLYIRQDTRLPVDYMTSDSGGFLITEDITNPDIFLCQASPNIGWVSHQAFISILPSKISFATVACLAVPWGYDRYSDVGSSVKAFGVKFHYYRRRSGDARPRMEKENLIRIVGSPADEFIFSVADDLRVASANMQLGLIDRLVIIKVAIRIQASIIQ